ncbi:unnamed protein product [Durusdinium trenchii]|uniref:Kinase n=1 Tax=Durusdinium trenchii TaxID=1381693 RepID=A0ABP0MX27_9DINO
MLLTDNAVVDGCGSCSTRNAAHPANKAPGFALLATPGNQLCARCGLLYGSSLKVVAGAGMPPESKKRKEPEPVEDLGLGGLYDFLPPPDPEKDKATATKARKAEQASTRPQLPPIDRSRVIFLDVDGVLLPAGSVEMIYIDGVMLPVRAAKEADFSRVALSNLRSIVQQTGATIVVSSEWRRREEMRDNIRRTLMTQDLPGFQDSTPIFQPSAELIKQRLDQAIIWAERRAREIGSWLKQHKEVKAWVAIDDIDFSWADSVKVPGTPLMKHRSVLTNPKHCITEKDADEAVRILLNPPVIAPGEEADAIAAARYLTEEALAKCNGGALMRILRLRSQCLRLIGECERRRKRDCDRLPSAWFVRITVRRSPKILRMAVAVALPGAQTWSNSDALCSDRKRPRNDRTGSAEPICHRWEPSDAVAPRLRRPSVGTPSPAGEDGLHDLRTLSLLTSGAEAAGRSWPRADDRATVDGQAQSMASHRPEKRTEKSFRKAVECKKVPLQPKTPKATILKPVDEADRYASREVLAYQALGSSSLGPFLSKFHGVRSVGSVDYMELESAYAGLVGPTATLDIKIGKKTWEDDASPAKVAKESKKFDEVYSASSAMDGFRVAGMKAGALVLQSENLKPRGSLKTDEFAAWLLPAFFASPPGFGPLPPDPSAAPVPPESVEIDVRTARAMLEQLQAISVAAEAGFGGTLRAASLLFTREMRLGGRCA